MYFLDKSSFAYLLYAVIYIIIFRKMSFYLETTELPFVTMAKIHQTTIL
jgi:hypothetical protein